MLSLEKPLHFKSYRGHSPLVRDVVLTLSGYEVSIEELAIEYGISEKELEVTRSLLCIETKITEVLGREIQKLRDEKDGI